jgi:hypothetical protein
VKPTLLRTAAFLVCAAALPLAQASDFTGIYARIDKVVLEPATGSPERIQIWGVFSISDGNRTTFSAPARGYLYAKLEANAQATLAEWNDLKQVAGTGGIVAFGLNGRTLRLRKPADKLENPDPYPLNIGVTKVQGRTGYPPVKALEDYQD